MLCRKCTVSPENPVVGAQPLIQSLDLLPMPRILVVYSMSQRKVAPLNRPYMGEWRPPALRYLGTRDRVGERSVYGAYHRCGKDFNSAMEAGRAVFLLVAVKRVGY